VLNPDKFSVVGVITTSGIKITPKKILYLRSTSLLLANIAKKYKLKIKNETSTKPVRDHANIITLVSELSHVNKSRIAQMANEIVNEKNIFEDMFLLLFIKTYVPRNIETIDVGMCE
jgi:hypothetical protein